MTDLKAHDPFGLVAQGADRLKGGERGRVLLCGCNSPLDDIKFGDGLRYHVPVTDGRNLTYWKCSACDNVKP